MYGLITTHQLAKELLKKDDCYLTVTVENREYIIESICTTKTIANMDDSCIYKTLQCKEY